MLRIADLLNNIGEDDSQLPDANTRAHVKLGRSVFALSSLRSGNKDAAIAMMAMAEEDEHAAFCSEDKRLTHTSTRVRFSFARMQEKAVTKKSPRRLSFHRSQQLRNIMNPSKSTEESDVSTQRDVTSKKRSTRSLFPEVSEFDRRAKQRLIVKRCYYKKINTIESLRNEASTLKQQFCLALHAIQRKDETVKAAGHGGDIKLREMFINTLVTKETLREEHIRLRRLADEYYMKNQGRLRQLLDSNHKGLILFTAAVNND